MKKIGICEKIKTIREYYHLTQDQLSRKIKVERSYISRIENGDDNVSTEVLRNIVKAFPGITADWLIDTSKERIVFQDSDKNDIAQFVQINRNEKIFLILKSLLNNRAQEEYNRVIDMMINDISIKYPKTAIEMKMKVVEY